MAPSLHHRDIFWADVDAFVVRSGKAEKLRESTGKDALHALGTDGNHLVFTLKTAGDTESGVVDGRALAAPQPTSLADVERDHILATLRLTNWNKSRTATILGIERSTLDRKIRRYELSDGRLTDDD